MILQDDFYTVDEAANKLKCNTRYVRDKIKSKQLKAYKKGKRYYILHTDLIEFIRS